MSLHFPASGFPMWRRRPLVTPLITGLALAVVALAGQTRLGAWLRGYLSSSRRVGLGESLTEWDDGVPSLDELRWQILGSSMASVVNAFGLPRTMQMRDESLSAIGDAGAGGFWRSELWYYPLDGGSQTGMAIHFCGGVARRVEFFELAPMIGS